MNLYMHKIDPKGGKKLMLIRSLVKQVGEVVGLGWRHSDLVQEG